MRELRVVVINTNAFCLFNSVWYSDLTLLLIRVVQTNSNIVILVFVNCERES